MKTSDNQWKYTDLADRERYIRLRHMIENHPYLSGMLCDEFANMLDCLIMHHTEAFAEELEHAYRLRKEPLDIDCEITDLVGHQEVPEEYLT